MISLDTIPVLLLAGFAALLVAGLAVGVWGKRLPRHGDWLVGIPLAYLLVVLGMAWNGLAEDHFTARVWNRGWIWPRDQVGAITVGLVIDPLGLALAALAAAMAVLYLVDLRERSPKDVGALALSAMGVMLAWTALTPWIAFCGMAAAIFGGFLSTGSRWDEEKGAVVAARFAWERCWGLLLAAVGLCILAGSRGALEFAGTEWPTQAAGVDPLADWIGTSVLLLGLLVQFQPFPFFGGLVAESGQPAPARALLRQIFPGWGAFALLLRIGPHLQSAGPFFTINWQILGWVGFASSALAVASGLMQSGWKTSLSFWISASFCAAVGVLSFAGPQAATALVLGTGLGALILAKAGDALEGKAAGKEASAAARGRWFKVATVFGAAAATGMIGFVSAGGALGGLAANADNPAVLVALAVVLLLDAVLCWSFVWQIARLGSSARAPWPSVVVTFTLVALSLGLPWTGTASGGAISESPDALFGSLFAVLFTGSGSPAQPGAAEATAFVTASGAHWGGLALALLIAFWAFGRKADGEKPSMSERSPRFAEFVSSGYGVDRGIARVRATYVSSAEAIEWALNDQLWKKWLPALFTQAIRGTARVAIVVNDSITEGLGIAIRRAVEAPAKGLQLIQNGDVRWYLLFAVGSGFLILLHFAGVSG